jgi:hypothetical protein
MVVPRDSQTTLLTYDLNTAPSPLQVSASLTELSVATLTIVVSCKSEIGTVEVSQIEIALPVRGDTPDATELALIAPPAGSAAITATDPWLVAPGVAPGVFTFTPQGGRTTISAQSLLITFNNITISTLVGTADIHVLEWASATAEPPPVTDPPYGSGTIPVSKFPQGFHFSDFAADATQVDPGGTVNLTWVGSTNADYLMSFAKQKADVTNLRSWTSPPLYTNTTFDLRASATENGKTVSLVLNTSVEVEGPTVVYFYAKPNRINVGEPVTLHWRTVNADGAYLITGQTDVDSLKPVSDDTSPTTITLKPGVSCTLSAYKTGHDGEKRSAPVLLDFTFLPLKIKFAADPAVVSQGTPVSRLSWEVVNTLGVTVQGRDVDKKGSQSVSPLHDTTYTLKATAIDGTVTTKDQPVKSRKITAASFNVEGPYRNGLKDVTISIATTAQSLDVSNVTVRFLDNSEGMPLVTNIQSSDGQWLVSLWHFSANEPVETSTLIVDLTIDNEAITGFVIPPTGYAPS